jgi:hypothetical protein
MYKLRTAELQKIAPIIPSMADTKGVSPSLPTVGTSPPGQPVPGPGTCREDAMVCERCGKAEMYRMHAVWRCPACGYKTDCCGW